MISVLWFYVYEAEEILCGFHVLNVRFFEFLILTSRVASGQASVI